jgi:sulfhydrogenase subunit alpha
MSDVHIDVHHVTRVEGHGNIVVNVRGGQVEECRFEVVETPRFFEAMLQNRPYEDASHITSRICGICSVGHATTSLRATERALGIIPSEQTVLLRELNFFGELLDSHVLHAYMLVAPDLLGLASVIPLARSAPAIVQRALRLKKLAGDICRILCGRHTHPIAMTVGGFRTFPTEAELTGLRERLVSAQSDVDATVELFTTLRFPDFERKTEYVALSSPGRYCFIDGEIRTSLGTTLPLDEYRHLTNEQVVSHSSAKHTHHARDSYLVGALSRFKLNHAFLNPRARSAALALRLSPMTTNPYLNTVAQVVEIVHAVEESLLLVDRLLAHGITPEPPVPPARLSGTGVGACEAPRGVLFHCYEIEEGRIVRADCVIPTGQNLANLEADMRSLVPTLLHLPPQQIRFGLEMLVRAYDPCISCSTHLVELRLHD